MSSTPQSPQTGQDIPVPGEQTAQLPQAPAFPNMEGTQPAAQAVDPQQLAQMLQQLTAQMNQLQSRLDNTELTNEELQSQLSRVEAQNKTLEDKNKQLEDMAASKGTETGALMDAIKELVSEVKRDDKDKSKDVQLVDTKGIGRPFVLSNPQQQFPVWRTRVENFISSAFPGADLVMDWCAEQGESQLEIKMPEVEDKFGPHATDPNLIVADLAQINHQLRNVLLYITDGETYEIVDRTAKGDGFNAWRQVTHRWDPMSAQRRRMTL